MGTPVPEDDLAQPFCWYGKDADGKERRWLLPTYNQVGDSCAAEAFCNAYEALLRRYVRPELIGRVVSSSLGRPDAPWQLAGSVLWHKCRESYWNDPHGRGGLFGFQPIKMAETLGWAPPGTRWRDVDPSWKSVCHELREQVLLQAHRVDPGWFRADRQSGLIDHSYIPPLVGNGHMTLLVGTFVHGGKKNRASLGSWGRDYGHDGIFVMTDAKWRCNYLGDLYALVLPDGWEEWEGWGRGLIGMQT